MNKLFYYKLIAESLKNELNLTDIHIHFKNIYKGFSSAKGYISIPLWTLKNNSYCIYYIIHELCHQVIYKRLGHFKHDADFKNEETILLNKFNLIPVYSKSYVKELIKNNISVYKRTYSNE
jgi:hypothetical protein